MMQSWIEDTYGIVIPENTIHNRLKAGGYTFKSSRPNPYKGDPNLQAAFIPLGQASRKKRNRRTTSTFYRETTSFIIR